MQSSRSRSHKDLILSQSVVKRRKKRRKIRLIILAVLCLACMGLFVWLTTLQSIQIKRVVVVGNANVTSEEIQSVANSFLDQRYIGLFPKRNAFIYPKNNIRDALLSTYPRISDIQIYTESFSLLNIKIKERTPAAVWCAAVKCYLVGADSYIYAEEQDQDPIIASSSLPRLSGGDELVGPEPIGKYAFNPKLFENLLFVNGELEKMNLDIRDVQVFSRDEIVFNLSQGGKVIFADRKPFDQSLEDLKSALSSSVFSSTSNRADFDYIDTRFGNKVFYRIDKNSGLKGSSSTSTASSSTKNKI